MSIIREIIPAAADLPDIELQDHLPRILPLMADVMASATQHDVDELLRSSPAQGITRFRQRYNVRELMTEDRMLRRVIIEHVEIALHRRLIQAEQLALDTSIDLMLQEAVVAFITEQHQKLRDAAEVELKYLSFMSHDLNNNLGSVTLNLQVLRQRLESAPEFAADVETLDAAQRSILETVGGMRRLLQSERLRKAGVVPEPRPVSLARLVSSAVMTVFRSAAAKGLVIAEEVPADAIIESDLELVSLIVQNLLGNAVKYSLKGTIRVRARVSADECLLSISDEGPGIAVEHLHRIFDAFQRGEGHGEPGVGLGLTIAAQAAKLLGAKLSVESTVGVGSTFFLTLRS
jgi:signal transduction histidine kinase